MADALREDPIASSAGKKEQNHNKKPIRVHPMKCPLAYRTGPFTSSAFIDQTGKECVLPFE